MKQRPNQCAAFTSDFQGLQQKIITPTEVLAALSGGTPRRYGALWDTGATHSCVTPKVVNQLGLKPSGLMMKMGSAFASKETKTYLVDLILPNGVRFPKWRVAEIADNNDWNVIIGMDIIQTGDFAITNKENRTVCSFRMPSLARIDFVEDAHIEDLPRNQRRETKRKKLK